MVGLCMYMYWSLCMYPIGVEADHDKVVKYMQSSFKLLNAFLVVLVELSHSKLKDCSPKPAVSCTFWDKNQGETTD